MNIANKNTAPALLDRPTTPFRMQEEIDPPCTIRIDPSSGRVLCAAAKGGYGSEMSAAGLEGAMADMEAARAVLESSTSRVGAELSRLQERVSAANGKAVTERLLIADGERKTRRLYGGAATAAQGDNPDAAAEGAFRDAADDVHERLQAARRAMARAHAATQAVRAAVDAAKASARELLSPARLASAKEARNEGCNELVRLMGVSDSPTSTGWPRL